MHRYFAIGHAEASSLRTLRLTSEAFHTLTVMCRLATWSTAYATKKRKTKVSKKDWYVSRRFVKNRRLFSLISGKMPPEDGQPQYLFLHTLHSFCRIFAYICDTLINKKTIILSQPVYLWIYPYIATLFLWHCRWCCFSVFTCFLHEFPRKRFFPIFYCRGNW